MSELKTTAGPWINCGDDEADGVPYLVIETDQPTGPDLRIICHVQPEYDDAKDRFFIDEQAVANASLIAAAPELYEALAMISNQWAGHAEQCALMTSQYSGQCDCDWPKVAKQCDAALAKARGEA